MTPIIQRLRAQPLRFVGFVRFVGTPRRLFMRWSNGRIEEEGTQRMPNKPDRANRRQPLHLGETVGEVRITDCPAAVAHPERSARLMNANGVPSSSPGLRRQALPWVIRSILSSTPSGLHHGRQIGADGTPLGFGAIWGRLPRVGAPSSRQPWAEGWNAFGVRGVWCFSSVAMPAAEKVFSWSDQDEPG